MALSSKDPATARQLRFIRTLAQETESTFTNPKTNGHAKAEIQRLLQLKRTGRHLRPEHTPLEDGERDPSIAGDPEGYAPAAHADEITGYGSTARWRTTAQREPESVPNPKTEARKEVARYTLTGGERVIYGHRVDGRARLTDCPAEGEPGEAHLIEDDLQLDGNEAMQALLTDYLEQARRLDRVPAERTLGSLEVLPQLARELGVLVGA
ncbi:MAG TPA: hypothetical protein VHT29_13660 [Solirubrobacteraceae bacterium]|jgi:hypothetical protein|nr:hypothetical protein [Solirubrobacteraceae bacterium]